MVVTQGERFHIKCIQNAVEQADQHAQTLKNDWANKTPDDAHAILSKPDISVTNQKDKDGQLPKIKALNTTVQAAFVRIKQQRDKVEREARDAETALDDAAADLEACMLQVNSKMLSTSASRPLCNRQRRSWRPARRTGVPRTFLG